MYQVIDLICTEEQTARDLAMCGASLAEAETHKLNKLPTHSRFVDSINGVDIWYDYGADYHFFLTIEQ